MSEIELNAVISSLVHNLDILRTKAAIDQRFEDNFNEAAEAKHLGIRLYRGKFYRDSYGVSHTAALSL